LPYFELKSECFKLANIRDDHFKIKFGYFILK
jgi:hypothetical protein